jgi:hypothetical protein
MGCLARIGWVPLLGLALGCSAAPNGSASLGQNSQGFVNGSDDRLEYFELGEASQRAALEQFSVALMSAGAAERVVRGEAAELDTWAEVNGLCPGEPFADQPSAAVCSGVLLDWNLVLTSGHCVTILPFEDLRVVFGYYYTDTGELAVGAEDVYRVARVLASRRDPADSEGGERLDFAWLELDRDVSAERRPAPAFVNGPAANVGASVISIGAGGGVPLKWDAGGHVQRTRPEVDDYFVADTDTSEGSSGGGIFDENLTLLGSLARGAVDFSISEAGCYVTATESDPAEAREQFTHVHRAVQALCAEGSSSPLCDPACGEPCDVSRLEGPELAADESGCSLTAGGAPHETSLPLALALTALLLKRRARGRRLGSRFEPSR